MTGLLLEVIEYDKKTFETFLSKWEEINGGFNLYTMNTNGSVDVGKEDFVETISCDCDFLLTASDGTAIEGGYYTSDLVRSVHITPILRSDGELNVPILHDYNDMEKGSVSIFYCHSYDSLGLPDDIELFIIPTKYKFEGPSLFAPGNKRYESPQEIIDEFKESLGKYFPDDFDWNSHIGYIHVNS